MEAHVKQLELHDGTVELTSPEPLDAPGPGAPQYPSGDCNAPPPSGHTGKYERGAGSLW